MNKSDPIEDLQSRIAFLEKHVTEQDAEMYQLSKRIDGLVKVAKEQKAQLAAVAELNSQGAGDMPADENRRIIESRAFSGALSSPLRFNSRQLSS